ncbi:hypothetical protein Fmac_019079 [Flemingia macrophylla]|uniref:MYB transcription factor n=1 Tax=Flemingia macrophylla TaxID=520843 RepID=A0ABD1M6S4_9FABA
MTKSSTEKNGLKKGPWTPEEDQKLIDYIQQHGHGKWRTLPKNAGRTDNEIKNYWNTHIKKRLIKMGIDPVTHTPRLDVLQLASFLSSSLYNSPPFNNYPFPSMGGSVINPSHLLSLLTTLLSCQNRNPDVLLNHNYMQQRNNNSGNPQLQNQPQCSQTMQLDSIQTFHPNQLQENHIAKTNSMETKLDHEISPFATSFSHQNNLPNLWHYNNGDHIIDLPQAQSLSAMQCFSSSSPKFNTSVLENQTWCINEGMPNFNLSSLLSSTPSSSSPSTLNSSSSATFVNGTTEDERDTHGSNMLMYNISNGLNDSGFL